MRFSYLFALSALLPLTGCHSAFINATVTNQTPDTLSLIEVDYPSASFGTQTLAPGATYSYRFKVLGSGPTTVLWTDAAHHDHKQTGPDLHESDEGTLAVAIEPTKAEWQVHLLHH